MSSARASTRLPPSHCRLRRRLANVRLRSRPESPKESLLELGSILFRWCPPSRPPMLLLASTNRSRKRRPQLAQRHARPPILLRQRRPLRREELLQAVTVAGILIQIAGTTTRRLVVATTTRSPECTFTRASGILQHPHDFDSASSVTI